MGRAFVIVFAVGTAALVTAWPGRASLDQPGEPVVVPVRPDGTGDALPLGEFKRRMATLGNIANPTLKNASGRNPDRDRVLARVKAARQARTRSAADAAVLGADLLRLGDTNEALDLLLPRTRDRTPAYFVFTTLAQVHAARGEWAEAVTYHDAALLDSELPAGVKGLTSAQRGWVARLDRDYVPHYYRIQKAAAEAKPRPDPQAEEPTPLFPLPVRGKPAAPVRFVNAAGRYEPGALAPAERAKLPPDAVAVVQQLLLWFPSDTWLYWLLGELYAAAGKVAEAQQIMDACVSEDRKYGNRRLLVEHRVVVRAAAAAKRQADEAAEAARQKAEEEARAAEEARQTADRKAAVDAVPISLTSVAVYFGVVVAVAAFAVARTLFRRGKRPPAG